MDKIWTYKRESHIACHRRFRDDPRLKAYHGTLTHRLLSSLLTSDDNEYANKILSMRHPGEEVVVSQNSQGRIVFNIASFVRYACVGNRRFHHHRDDKMKDLLMKWWYISANEVMSDYDAGYSTTEDPVNMMGGKKSS